MPILEAEDYEEIIDHSNDKSIVDKGDSFVVEDGQAIACFSAFASRETLSGVADEIGLDEEGWKKFKWAEEYTIEAVVDLETGDIIKARLV